MVEGDGWHKIGSGKLDLIFTIFFSVTALLVLGCGFYYWLRLVGVYEALNWRFDLMNWQWRTLSASLAVLYPVAACGLWQQAHWGVILWLIGALCEGLCFTFFAQFFGFNLILPLLHLIFLTVYIVLTLYSYRTLKKSSEIVTQY